MTSNKQLWNVKADSTFILYTIKHTFAHTYHCRLHMRTANCWQVRWACIYVSTKSLSLWSRCDKFLQWGIFFFFFDAISHTIMYCPSLISSTAYSFRVSIWPPPQRAPAPAVVLTDKSAHHEPEEWGRGGTTTCGPPDFRWVVLSSHENHDLGSSPRKLFRENIEVENLIAFSQWLRGNFTLSPLPPSEYLWLVLCLYLNNGILILLAWHIHIGFHSGIQRFLLVKSLGGEYQVLSWFAVGF